MRKIPKGNTKDRVMDVWNKLESEGKGLLWYARRKPEEFYKLFVRSMLPKEVSGTIEHGEGPALFQINIIQGELHGKETIPTLPTNENLHNE